MLDGFSFKTLISSFSFLFFGGLLNLRLLRIISSLIYSSLRLIFFKGKVVARFRVWKRFMISRSWKSSLVLIENKVAKRDKRFFLNNHVL